MPVQGGTGEEPAAAGPGGRPAYQTEMFAFVDEESEQSEEVIDWLKFSESRTERREEAKRRGRNRRSGLVVLLVLALLGGAGYLWQAGKLPGFGKTEAAQAAATGPQKRDVIVVHLIPVNGGPSDTALLVDNSTKGRGTTLLLPNTLSTTSDDGTAAPLDKAVGDGIGPQTADYVLTYGERARHIAAAAARQLPPERVRSYDDKALLAAELLRLIQPDDVVLVKGSRGMALEDVVAALLGESRRFGVSVASESQCGLIDAFARLPAGEARFAQGDWREATPEGQWVLRGALAAFECSLEEAIPRHAHLIVLGRVETLLHAESHDAAPLIHWRRAYRRLSPA